MNFLLTQDHMGLEISKRYSSYSFHPMSIKLNDYICYHAWMQGIAFHGIWPSVKSFVALWNFNLADNRKIIKCAISGKQLAVERNGWKFGTHSPRNSLCRVLFGSGHLSSVWGHVHFAKFPMLRFSKGYCSHTFHPICFGVLPNFKSIWHIEDKLPLLHCHYP